jgi:hypothetical protein
VSMRDPLTPETLKDFLKAFAKLSHNLKGSVKKKLAANFLFVKSLPYHNTT